MENIIAIAIIIIILVILIRLFFALLPLWIILGLVAIVYVTFFSDDNKKAEEPKQDIHQDVIDVDYTIKEEHENEE